MHLKKVMNNKRGFSYIITCVIILVVVMIVFITLQYAYVFHVAREQKNETQLKLDGYVTRCAIENYDALKQGDAWNEYIDRNELVAGAYSVLSFQTIITSEYNTPVAVTGKYDMSRPTISPLGGDAFGVVVQYEIKIPYELFNQAFSVTVPVEIVSRYTKK